MNTQLLTHMEAQSPKVENNEVNTNKEETEDTPQDTPESPPFVVPAEHEAISQTLGIDTDAYKVGLERSEYVSLTYQQFKDLSDFIATNIGKIDASDVTKEIDAQITSLKTGHRATIDALTPLVESGVIPQDSLLNQESAYQEKLNALKAQREKLLESDPKEIAFNQHKALIASLLPVVKQGRTSPGQGNGTKRAEIESYDPADTLFVWAKADGRVSKQHKGLKYHIDWQYAMVGNVEKGGFDIYDTESVYRGFVDFSENKSKAELLASAAKLAYAMPEDSDYPQNYFSECGVGCVWSEKYQTQKKSAKFVLELPKTE